MNEARNVGLFESDRCWLEDQPGMQPWDHGCDGLEATLERLLKEYAAALHDRPVTRDHPRYLRYLGALWQCLRHHWKTARDAHARPVGCDEVVEHLRRGRGFRRGRQLGGNPLRDVILAQAVLIETEENKARPSTRRRNGNGGHAERASNLFAAEFYDFAVRQAGTVHASLARRPEVWWGTFLADLWGYRKNGRGKLNGFKGMCGLKYWLGTVVKNFARNLMRSRNAAAGNCVPWDDASTPEPSDRLAPVIESMPRWSTLQRVVDDSLRQMDAGDQALLYLRFVHQISQKQIAHLLDVDPGNVSRKETGRKDRARNHLRKNIVRRARQSDAGKQCIEYIESTWRDARSSRFGDLLYASLEKRARFVYDWLRDNLRKRLAGESANTTRRRQVDRLLRRSDFQRLALMCVEARHGNAALAATA